MEGQAEGGDQQLAQPPCPCREGLPARRPVPRGPGLHLAVEHRGRKEGPLNSSSNGVAPGCPPSLPEAVEPTTQPQFWSEATRPQFNSQSHHL